MTATYEDFYKALSRQGLMGDRSTKSRSLLDATELNLGVSAPIPSIPPYGVTGDVYISQPIKLLDLTATSSRARTVTVVMTTYANGTDDPSFIQCPVTGIVEYGSGSSIARVEFDLQWPSPYPFVQQRAGDSYVANYNLLKPYNTATRGAVALSVQASSVRVFARNDKSFPWVYPAVYSGQLLPLTGGGSVVPQVTAFVAYGESFGSNSRLYRTLPLALSLVSDNNAVSTDTSEVIFPIPPFAKTFYILRQPYDTALRLKYARRISGVDVYEHDLVLGSGENGPFLIPPSFDKIWLKNVGTRDIDRMSILFELTL